MGARLKEWNVQPDALRELGACMRRVAGLALFFTGIGMVIALIAPKGLIMVLIAAVCLLAGYNLFCCP